MMNETKLVKEWLKETGGYVIMEYVIDELREEETATDLLSLFTTDEMIKVLDERGELGIAYGAYVEQKYIDEERRRTPAIVRMDKEEKLKLIADIIGIGWLCTPVEYANALLEYVSPYENLR